MTRKAYCTGCGLTFQKHHTLYNHRRSNRCGGIYLPVEERRSIDLLRSERERQLRTFREQEYAVKMYHRYGRTPELAS